MLKFSFKQKSALALMLGLLGVTAFQNCSRAAFNPAASADQASSSAGNPNAPSGGNPNCTTVLQNTARPIRILFMVDNSDSTTTTDPQKFFRSQAITNFIATYASHTNLTYQFSAFGGKNSTATAEFITDAKGAPYFGTAQDLRTALAYFGNVSTKAGTPYLAAFSDLQTLVHSDLALPSTAPQGYAIIFMSDGMPTDMPSKDPQAIDQVLQNQVAQLLAISPGSVSLSTVYFGPEDSNGVSHAEHLKSMAGAGGGLFVDTNLLGGRALSIEDVVQVPGTVCTNN